MRRFIVMAINLLLCLYSDVVLFTLWIFNENNGYLYFCILSIILSAIVYRYLMHYYKKDSLNNNTYDHYV